MFAPVGVVEDGVLLSDDLGAAVVVDGGVAPSDGPGVDEWAWPDPLGDAWWDSADTGAEPGIEVHPELAALLGAAPGLAVDPRAEAPAELTGWLSAACLAAMVPGAGLAGVLERIDLPSADDELLVETVAAGERLAAWAHLGAALAAGELSHRASMNPLWHQPVPARTCVAGDELAMRLGWSRPAANRLVRDGRALECELLPVADAVRDGLLDTAKLRVLTDRLHDRPDQLSWPVLDQVLPDAATRTPTQLAADVDRALLAIDPLDAAIRLPKAIASRHVCHPRRLPDGMAGLWAVLPATDAARIDGTLEATARAARAAGDPRTLDQLRADTLTDLATGTALLAGARLDPPAGAGLNRPAGGEAAGREMSDPASGIVTDAPLTAASHLDDARLGGAHAFSRQAGPTRWWRRTRRPSRTSRSGRSGRGWWLRRTALRRRIVRRGGPPRASGSPRSASTSPSPCPPSWDWTTSPVRWPASVPSPPSRPALWRPAARGVGSSPTR